MATTISTIFNKTLFQRLLNSRKLNTEIIYFDKTTTSNGENINKVFNINPSIFYKSFEIEVNYDITNQTQPKNTVAFFCCRKENKYDVPTIHVFAVNKMLTLDMCNNGSTQRLTNIFSLNNKGKINIQYIEGIIKIYYDDVLKNTYDLSNFKITNGLSKKCSVGQSYSEVGGLMANGINGTVNVKIKKLNV